jgi:TrmH family RNA methyltransferase
MRRISSRQNPIVARFRDLARGRGSDGSILLDGEHLIEEALASGVALDTVAFAETAIERHAGGLVERVEHAGATTLRVPPMVLSAMSPVRQPSGIVAIARSAPATLDAALEAAPQLVLILAGIQDAGNVGAIVRAADGCGATGILTTDGTADPFGWKALRGAMGSTFRLPIAVKQPISAVIDAIKQRRIALVATLPRQGRRPSDTDLTTPAALVLGAEGAGVPPQLLDAATVTLTIPMRAPVESLNVAITAALILYEASQQRAHRHVVIRGS